MAMLEWSLLLLFGTSCALLLKDGVADPRRVFEFPFLAGTAVSAFLLTQAIGVVRAGDLAPDTGVAKFLLVSSLCCLAIRRGWRRQAKHRPSRPSGAVPDKYLYLLGLGMLALGLWARWRLGELTGGLATYYSTEGAYALEWRGLPAVYAFLGFYLEAGIVVCGFTALRVASRLALLPMVMALLIPLADVIFLGRRMRIVFLLLTAGLIAFFWRRVAPTRTTAFVCASLVAASVFVVPHYRAHSQLGGDWQAIKAVRPGEVLAEILSGVDAEVANAAYLVQVTEEKKIFQYGIGFYNTFIRYFVPRTFLGDETKQSLLIDVPDAGHVGPEAGEVLNRYAWAIPQYLVPTGPASVFQQFWYLGAACFYLLSRWLKRHWLAAMRGELWSQVVYTVSVPYAMAAVINDVYAIYHPVFMIVLPTLVVARLWRAIHGLVTRSGVYGPESRSRRSYEMTPSARLTSFGLVRSERRMLGQ